MKLVIQTCGLSGAGKTKMSNILHDMFNGIQQSVKIFDGNEWRKKIEEEWKVRLDTNPFSRCAREASHWMILEEGVIPFLQNSGNISIIATLAPFFNLREDMRIEIKKRGFDYVLVYFKVPFDTCMKRSRKRKSQGSFDFYGSGTDNPWMTGQNTTLHNWFDHPSDDEAALIIEENFSPEESASLVFQHCIERFQRRPGRRTSIQHVCSATREIPTDVA